MQGQVEDVGGERLDHWRKSLEIPTDKWSLTMSDLP